MRFVWTLLLGIYALAPIAEAQPGASDLSAPRPAVSSSSAVAPAAAAPSPAVAALTAPAGAGEDSAPTGSETTLSSASEGAASPVGPRIELGYALYSFSDGETSGRVHAGSFGGYFYTGDLRLGARAEVGKRADRLGVDDVLVRAIAVAGYQYRGSPWVPYLVAVGSYGWLIEQGTLAPRTAALPGVGLELGLDLRFGAVFVGVSAGWTRVWLRGESQNLWLLRVRTGV